MTVLSKVLYGSVHVKAYDWVKVENSSSRTSNFGKIFIWSDQTNKSSISFLWWSCYVCCGCNGRNIVDAVGLARSVVNGIQSAPCEPSILFPKSGGNIHSFTALTPCAILDVLSPPYSEDHGRSSTYFSEFPIHGLPGNPQSTQVILMLIVLLHYKFIILCLHVVTREIVAYICWRPTSSIWTRLLRARRERSSGWLCCSRSIVSWARLDLSLRIKNSEHL